MDLVFINIQGVFLVIHIAQVLLCIVAAMIPRSIKNEWEVLSFTLLYRTGLIYDRMS